MAKMVQQQNNVIYSINNSPIYLSGDSIMLYGLHGKEIYCFVRTEMSDNVIFSCCLVPFISLLGTVHQTEAGPALLTSVKKINPKCLRA